MYRIVKRWLDVIFATLALAAVSPLLLAAAAAIRLTMGRPVMFRQIRAGLAGRPISIYKFRTMRDLYDAEGNPLPDNARQTPLGAFLRRTSIDELPQLWNVLKGEMSLVGPRPLYLEYIPFYTVREATRLAVLPGITGLAQVSGRNSLSWDERLELDAQYVEKMSLGLDLAILFRTLIVILRMENIEAPASVKGNFIAQRSRRPS